jgi:hypothetical protein
MRFYQKKVIFWPGTLKLFFGSFSCLFVDYFQVEFRLFMDGLKEILFLDDFLRDFNFFAKKRAEIVRCFSDFQTIP